MLNTEIGVEPGLRKVHLISLGCARNRVDSEVMLGTLFKAGWDPTDYPGEADAIVINTCGFIDSAKEESVDTILQAAEHKKQNPDLKLVVAGCLTQRYRGQLAKGLPEVDLFVGTDQFPRIGEFLADRGKLSEERLQAARSHYIYSEHIPRVNTLARHSAYVKVAEGCQHSCSFCIIPAIRGKLRSRSVESVVNEVRSLTEEGVIEINLIAQDLAAYGRDRKDGADLLGLLRALVGIEKLRWIRLLYVYPENISGEFLDFLASEDKIVKYLDIPSQHASDAILKAMKRDIDRQGLLAIFRELRERVPGIALRTSVMVGFPGETEEDFAQLKDFIREVKFRHLGCFSYSQEEGTVAGRMADQVDEGVKQRRLAEIMEIQRGISAENLEGLVGQVLPVLVEGPSSETDHLWEGRLSIQAPEVDGIVYINDGEPRRGRIQMVRITESHDYDLVGEIVDCASEAGQGH